MTEIKWQTITALLHFKSSWFGLTQTLDKIYFDTKGHYSHLRDAPLSCNWEISADSDSFFVWNLKHTTNGDTLVMQLEKDILSAYVYATSKNKAVRVKVKTSMLTIVRKSKTSYEITFNPAYFTVDEAMYVSNIVLSHLENGS